MNMKILFVSDYFQPYAVGAANISTFLAAKKLSEDNELFVITQKFQDSSWVYEGVQVYPLLPRYSSRSELKDIISVELSSIFKLQNFIAFYKTIRNFCISKKIDCLNVQTNNLTLLISLLLQNVPLVIDVRDYYFTCPFMLKTITCDRYHLFCLPANATRRKHWLPNFLGLIFFRYQTLMYFFQKNFIFKPLLRYKSNQCVFVTNSEYVRNELVREFKNIPINTQVIHNPVNASDYDNLVKGKKNIVLYASSLEQSKGIWNCIQAFEKVGNDIRLEVAGDGPEADAVGQYIKDKKIKNITLLGKLTYKDIPELYKRAYITIQPSVWPEPFGRYILESFASATPLITTPTGGTPEAIQDRETGLIVPVSDPDKLAKAIVELTSDKKLYNHIRGNIIKEAIKYQPGAIAKQREKLYKKMLASALGT